MGYESVALLTLGKIPDLQQIIVLTEPGSSTVNGL